MGGAVSFEVYFLRDLFAKGKVTEKLLDQVIQENGIPISLAEVLAVLTDKSGESLPGGLASHLANIASVVGDNN